MCYCKNGNDSLGQSIGEAQTKVPQLESEAKEAIAKATAIREKEAAAYAKESGEMKSNLDAMAAAIAAISKGMSGGFLQTNAAAVIRKLVNTNDHVMDSLGDMDRETVASFLSEASGSEYAPASGEIVGILKQMKETMEKDLGICSETEEAAIKAYEELMAAKKKEIEAATQAIESKLQRLGETSVQIVQMKNDLEDTQEGLADDTKFLADLAKNCEAKKKEWAERSKT